MSLSRYFDELLPEVAEQASFYEKTQVKISGPRDLSDYLGKLHYYGFPTPILSWSLSPYVAAYYAFRDLAEGDHARVYALRYGSWTRHPSIIESLREPDPVIAAFGCYDPDRMRLMRELRVSIISNASELAPFLGNHSETRLLTAEIPGSEREKALSELAAMGIDQVVGPLNENRVYTALKATFF